MYSVSPTQYYGTDAVFLWFWISLSRQKERVSTLAGHANSFGIEVVILNHSARPHELSYPLLIGTRRMGRIANTLHDESPTIFGEFQESFGRIWTTWHVLVPHLDGAPTA